MLSLIALSYLSCSSGPDVKIGVTNQPPTATIFAPADGASFDEATTITFEAMVNDSFDAAPDLEIVWASDIDGELLGGSPPSADGSVFYSTANLSPGIHTVSLSVFDSDGATASASVQLEIIDLPDEPTIEILHPSGTDRSQEGEPFLIQASVWDAQGNLDTLLATITSDIDGTICSNDNTSQDTSENSAELSISSEGLIECEHIFSSGEHFLEFIVINEAGYEATASTYFDVVDLDDIDNDGDGFSVNQEDCDDNDPSIFPGADEVANGADDDCDGMIDEGSENADDDGDGLAEIEGDCDDTDPSINPSGTEVENNKDDDCDGIIDEGTNAYDDDGDGFSENNGDCNDSNNMMHPGATEIANSSDDDCDGTTDEGTVAYDDDGDGFTELTGDCDDSNILVYPSANEVQNSVDDDCDGDIDEGTDAYDDDGDCYCEVAPCVDSSSNNCGPVEDLSGGDCNDANENIRPGLVELENGVDDNCDGRTDEGTNAYDDDGDGVSENNGDCDDTNANIKPGLTEIENGIDDNCNGVIDEGTNAYDDDGDCFCELPNDPDSGLSLCVASSSTLCSTIEGGDCNDLVATTYPDAPETANNVDDDCDGTTDEGTDAYDDDGDGFTENQGDCNDDNPNIKPGIAEICGDGIDNNCNGEQNEENASGCTTYFRDADGDGYGDLNASECWCSATGDFNVTGVNSSNDDCYDGNPNARPGQLGYFTSHRGDNSFDYNCDNTASQQYTDIGECRSALGSFLNFDCLIEDVGWNTSSPPACGNSAYYLIDDDSCSQSGTFSCGVGGPSYNLRTQACR